MTVLKSSLLHSLVWIAVSALSVASAEASSVMAVGQDEGYSGKVMDKIVSKWKPPKQLKKECRLKLIIGLDGSGNLLECRTQRSSGLEAVDASACAAVKAAAPFGAPPYGMPAEIFMTFWTGDTSNRLSPETPGTDARILADARAAENMAIATNDRARAIAEQAARESGKSMPVPGKGARNQVKKAGADPEAAENPNPAQDKATSKKTGSLKTAEKTADSQKKGTAEPAASPGTEAASVTQKKPATERSNTRMRPKRLAQQTPAHPEGDAEKDRLGVVEANGVAASSVNGESKSPALSMEEDIASQRQREKYLSRVTWNLRNLMHVPKEARPGKYEARVRVNCDKNGIITGYTITDSSGTEIVDKYILKGLKKAKKIPPPPQGLGNSLDLTFTMVRQ